MSAMLSVESATTLAIVAVCHPNGTSDVIYKYAIKKREEENVKEPCDK
jgi:hypothetical protein